jgi:hypothetical protein
MLFIGPGEGVAALAVGDEEQELRRLGPRHRQQGRAPGVVDGAQGFGQLLVERLVGIAATVGSTPAAGAVEGADESLERAGGFAGAGAPADQDEGEFRIAIRTLRSAGEEVGWRNRLDLDVDDEPVLLVLGLAQPVQGRGEPAAPIESLEP